jgi:hypothetical protein
MAARIWTCSGHAYAQHSAVRICIESAQEPLFHADPQKDWALAIAKRSNKRKARIALARRLAIIMHAMLRDGTDFAFA